MLKIKGLKKKKKGKKGKHKEEDLFDPQELEQYRREQQQKAEAGEQSKEGASASGDQSDEWQRFKALTSGVDDILKKTQDDLDRIKSTSYFQKKPPASQGAEKKKEVAEKPVPEAKKKRWIGFEDGEANAEQEEEDDQEKQAGKAGKVEEKVETVPAEEEEPEEEEEEEEECEEDEDIFDTSYVDVVASGEVKLAYIPDSPVGKEDDSFDPFDTSIVDKVIKTDPKKRNLVSLGSAVEVLTGKVDKPTCLDVTKKRRQRRQDLLLGSFDETENTDEVIVPKVAEETQVVKTILDEDTDIFGDEIDLSVNLAINLIPPNSAVVESKSDGNEDIVSKALDEQFSSVGNAPAEVKTESEADLNDDPDDGFATLAAESLLKETGTVANKDDSSETAESKKSKPERPPPPPDKGFDHDEDRSKNNFEELYEESDVADPFDTSFAENILPGKYELKLIEEEILLKEHEFPKISVPEVIKNLPRVSVSESEFKDAGERNEHNFLDDDQVPLSFQHRDLLGGSTTDLSKIGPNPIEPTPKEDDEHLSYSDPFDTSVADKIFVPGKTELKFLEKELLADAPKSTSTVDSDDDFDPRAVDTPAVVKPPARPDQLPVGEKRASVPKVVAFNIKNLTSQPDLLVVGHEESSKITKPLTPYYADPKDIENKPSFESEVDPFDTSYVTSVPGKHELKLIESELVGDIASGQQQINVKPAPNSILAKIEKISSVKPPTSLPITKVCSSPEQLRPDILSEDTVPAIKLHTPVVPKRLEDDIENIDYTDPFDTSIVNNLLPGKAELKLIEYELIGSDVPTTSIKRSYTDPDFNPRDSQSEDTQIEENIVDRIDEITVTEKSLTPIPVQQTETAVEEVEEDIDPFDTSCVEKLVVPGKVELKLLESELVSN